MEKNLHKMTDTVLVKNSFGILYSNLAQILPEMMKERLMTYTVAHQQRAIRMLWFHFWGAFMCCSSSVHEMNINENHNPDRIKKIAQK